MKVDGVLVDPTVIEKTTFASNVKPSPTKSHYSISKYASHQEETLIDFSVSDHNGDIMSGLKASDFTVELNGKVVSLASAPFKNFTSNSLGHYEATLSSLKKDDYTIKSPRVKGVLIETKQNWVPVVAPDGNRTPKVLISDSSSAAKPGTKQDRISLHVENINREAIPGLSASSFSVRINNGIRVTLADAPFSGFKDLGRGNYEVYFNGDHDTTYVLTEMSVDKYKPEGFYELIKTSKPKPTKRLYIAGDY